VVPIIEGLTLTFRSGSDLQPFYAAPEFFAMTINVRQLLTASLNEAATPADAHSDAGESDDLYSFEALPSLDALAEAQGVQAIEDIDDLVADFWPEDESIVDFMAAVRRWRDEEDTHLD
jgi:hypothetical protein